MMVKVIVVITTYNLEKYIAQTLDSILCQKTNFSYKILVADDASNDSTPHILSEYKNKFPEKIEVLFSDRNLGSVANSNRVFNHLECEYFSFLDGDDYWVSEDRLQKQVDFLDSHPNYSMCAGNTQYLIEEKMDKMLIKKKALNKSYSFNDYYTMPFIHTSSILLRNIIYINGLPDCLTAFVGTYRECAIRGEDFRRTIHLEKGPIFLMDDLFSVYRVHANGLYQGSSKVKRYIESAIQVDFLNEYFKEKHENFFLPLSESYYQKMMSYLVANKMIVSKNRLSPRDSYLLGQFIEHRTFSEEAANKESKGLNFKMFLLKVCIKIFHWI